MADLMSAFTTQQILDGKEKILYALHEDDEDWQLLGGEGNLSLNDVTLVSMAQVLEVDPSVAEILTIAVGQTATRHDANSKWEIK